MTPEEIAATRAEITDLAASFRTIATTGRTSLASVADSARATRDAITQTSEAGKTLSQSLSSGLDRAFKSALTDGAKLSDVLRNLALDVSRSLASSAISGLTNQLGGALGQSLQSGITGLLGFSKGATIDAGRVRAFAQGGVVNGPTLFPMHGGTGLMGEAGPEAIMPLQRGPDGRLGVAAQSGGSPAVTINITTPDVEGFRRSRTQIAATLARAVDRGRRNL